MSFADDVENILSDLSDTGAFIAIADIPDFTQLPRFREEPDADVTIERIAEFNRIITEAAARHGATVVRLSDNPIEDVLISDDGFHPSTEGHKRIAQEFLEVILPRFQNGAD